MRGALVLALLGLPATLLAGPKNPPRGPIAVFLTAREVPTPPSAEEGTALKQRAEALKAEREALYEDNKKQYGKKREKWPAEVLAAYYTALDAENTALTDAWYAAPDEKDKADSTEDVRRNFDGIENKHGWIALVASAEEADLVVQILGRYGGPKLLVGGKQIGFEILPGRIGADVVSMIPREWTRELDWMDLYVDHWLTPAEPFYRFEVSDRERWRDVAKRVVVVVVAFAKDNYDVLRPE